MQLECGKYGKFYPTDGLSGAALGAHSPDGGVINPESIEEAMGYGAFRGLEPDSAEQKNEKPIYPMSRLQNFCRYYHVRIGIITLKYTQSNSICFAYDGQAIGVGAGQQSRIHCTRLAGSKADTWFLRQHPRTLNLPFRADLGRANRDNVIDGYINGNEEDVCADGIWQSYFTEQPERLTEGDKKA